MHVEGKKIF